MGPRGIVGLLCGTTLVAGVAGGIAVDRFVLLRYWKGERHRFGRDGREFGAGREFGGREFGGREFGGPREFGPGGPRGDRGDRGDRELNRFVEKLSLDAEQTEKVRAILVAGRTKAGEVMREVRPRFKACREQTETEIRSVLRPDQVAKLDALRKEWEENVARVRSSSETRAHEKEGVK